MRAFLKLFITSFVCLAIIYGGYYFTSLMTKDVSATSYIVDLNLSPDTTITAASDTTLDIAANGPFCLFNGEDKINTICSTPDPRPGSPDATRLTTTLKAGKWLAFTPSGTNLYFESSLPLIYNRNDIFTAIIVDALLLAIFLILLIAVVSSE
ncbi:TPA: hypothetical protein DCP77_00820 [Candidatus Collierbacteria bacterium]|uniref:Uncharacterized protein n=1 Tax=Candidatus Collierbacteria bacterium GW2011_GWA2_42_17 TaxID=1618378 RepID=A0A0G0Z274_9BACT|nr:MAG: hypothetical protein UU94_C0002G0009 [Candidatus Collierbacteria bacterium GW2011_GWB2_42_12]KKS42867.1 MAG: hypothetical protein UV06_C0004G0002 [Candidatus Collierbacteria bacterium GW2011_GWA2_42_17]KKS61168.1 MAG: hypothetical protein UV28_C0040G0007 [Candidatus Collierbacteria bacterium GW2011_GWE2_42_48]KKS63285.1 MAG: hypothetical protein UV29_C0004G0042 [Candidatus Collierbacteria bacterium GW2011_GWD2_42_50]KKS64445.1 MAG: hypothetical protein UV32_C0014G0002 [Candidatus Collie